MDGPSGKRAIKGLKKESLRDNMTNTELALNMLAEAATTELSKEKNPQHLEEHEVIAKQGGKAAEASTYGAVLTDTTDPEALTYSADRQSPLYQMLKTPLFF